MIVIQLYFYTNGYYWHQWLTIFYRSLLRCITGEAQWYTYGISHASQNYPPSWLSSLDVILLDNIREILHEGQWMLKVAYYTKMQKYLRKHGRVLGYRLHGWHSLWAQTLLVCRRYTEWTTDNRTNTSLIEFSTSMFTVAIVIAMTQRKGGTGGVRKKWKGNYRHLPVPVTCWQRPWTIWIAFWIFFHHNHQMDYYVATQCAHFARTDVNNLRITRSRP